jgi:hypothetical protein
VAVLMGKMKMAQMEYLQHQTLAVVAVVDRIFHQV